MHHGAHSYSIIVLCEATERCMKSVGLEIKKFCLDFEKISLNLGDGLVLALI